jgi:hypothetical protein
MNSNLMGSNSILEFSDNLKKLKKELINQNNKIYVDSGGYSIIKGDVRFDSTKRFIECYNYFILNESSSCDRIFSLDIPFWGNIEDSMYMSKFNLEKYNDLSTDYLTKSISINKKIADKLHFVWHFKFKSQFDVWRKIFKSYGVNGVTAKYAIGGLVGLRERFQSTNGKVLDFSPFTSMAAKCLAEHLSGPLCCQRFCLHFLGVNHPVDRLQIALIELVFSEFCTKYGYPKPELTYDSINYTISAMNNSRSLKISSYEDGALTNYDNFAKVPSNIIRNVYITNEEYEIFKHEVNRFLNNEKYEKVDFLAPLNVYSEMSRDAFFTDSLKYYELYSEIISQNQGNHFYSNSRKKIEKLLSKNIHILTENVKSSVTNNCIELYLSVRYLLNGDMKSIDNRVEKTINTLRLPDPFF